MRKLLKVVAALFFMFSVVGCGSDGDSETNGTLTLTANAPVNVGAQTVTMTATAVLSPPMAGSDISFTTQLFNASGAIPFPPDATCSGTRPTGPSGNATISCNFPQPTVNATLQVSATAGGLAAIPVTIPIAGQ